MVMVLLLQDVVVPGANEGAVRRGVTISAIGDLIGMGMYLGWTTYGCQ